MKIGFRLWMRNVFTESLSMEFKRWKREMNTWFFSKENALSSHTKEWHHSLDTFQVSIVWSILIRNPLPCLTVVCVCVGKLAVARAIVENRDHATHNLFAL